MSQLLRPLEDGDVIQKGDLFIEVDSTKTVSEKLVGLYFYDEVFYQFYRPIKDNSLKHKNYAIIYWAAVGFITVGYFFFITCVK